MAFTDQPDLAAFIARHARPYDPATDTYRRAPFAQSVKAGKNSPIYNAHSYHTKVPPEGIVPYIEHYTDPGDLVLDPFCGSGMTGVAALMTGRNAILNDLSPAAVHIARNYCTPVDVEALRREFERIRAAVKEEFDWLYGTTCDRCGGPATIQYTIWSDVFGCGRCGGEIVLWDVALDPNKTKLSQTFACPSCGKEWRKARLQRLYTQPVLTCYQCRGGCKPKRQEHPISEEERELISTVDERVLPYWYPRTPLNPDSEMYIRGALHLRNIHTVDQLYTKRNLWAMARLWHEIDQVEDTGVKARLQASFTAICQLVSRMRRYRAGGFGGNIMSGLIYLPSLNLDVSVPKLWQTKFNDMLAAAEALQAFVRPDLVAVLTGSATSIPSVPDNTADYAFSDPPFGMNLYYSDLNIIWESWLGSFTDPTYEAVVHREQKVNAKTVADYGQLMTDSFREMYRVLKPGRWASVVFHNSDDRIWQVILDAAEASGFELAEINAFDKVQRSFKGIRGDKGLERVTNQDIVLNLHKPRPGLAPTPNGRTDRVDAEQRVVETVADFLAANPPPGQRTLQHLWNHVLYGMLRDGSVQVSMADVESMLAYHSQAFKVVDGRYYLRGEAVLEGNVFDLRSDAGAIAWLTAVLSNEPRTTGELIPQWQQETAALGQVDPGRLDHLLEQNFWPDRRTGRWRVPTAAEREQMSARADLGAQAHLRVVRRFLAGELDRQPTDLELCAWIRFCYGREFYAEGADLFPHVVESRVEDDEYRAVKRMAAVCRLRAGQGKENHG